MCKKNGNHLWHYCVKLEIDQRRQHDTYKEMGKVQATKEHKKIRSHFVFDVKHDSRHKARLLSDVHLTDVPTSSDYSRVVSLRGIRLVLFLTELNGLESWAVDIGNAYLKAFTKDKVCVIAGPEFEPLEGHNLIIVKTLCGI